MTIPINISLFAHIELDSELSGRFGVQGNTFHNTFGYLNQYFKTLSEMPPQVRKLAAAMDALVGREDYIRGIGGGIQSKITANRLDAFTLKTRTEVEALQPNENLLLPGGWLGTDSPGHAMIYQFEKNASGELFFSIYNSGSGIEQHNKTSSTEKELYSPVKTYQLPNPVDSIELQCLIKRLVVPQLAADHPARDKRKFDAEMVYNDIGVSLVFLNASLVSDDLSASHVTTASQLSGTCAQRSIHQMLKVNFDTLPAYQRFIFDFKMHALNDFVATHPSPPRSPGITAFIQKAIINNLKILQEPGVFNDEKEQAGAVDALKALQLQLDEERVASTSFFSGLVNFPSIWNPLANLFTSNHLATDIASFDTSEFITTEPHQPLASPVREMHLLSDLAAAIDQCKAKQETDPLWVMAQIEQ